MRRVEPAFAVALWASCASMAAVAAYPHEGLVSADSDFVRRAYSGPARDPHAVLVARETARIAGDKAASERLDAYAESMALAKLTGGEPLPAATIRDVVEGRVAAVDRQALRTRLLATTLRPRLAHRSDGYALFPAKENFNENRYRGHSVWTTHQASTGALYWVSLRVEIENAGPNTVTQFDATLKIRREAGDPISLECKPRPWMERGLLPGASAQHVCASDARYVSDAQLLAAVKAVESDPSRWTLEPSRINFAEFPISLNRHQVFWMSGAAARDEAVAKIKAASCSDRNSCSDDFRSKMQHDPAWAIGVPSLGLALILGIVFRLLGRYRWKAAAAASGLSIVALLATVAVTASSGGMGVLAAMVVAAAGAIALALFNGALWGTLWLLSLFPRGKPGVEEETEAQA